MPPPPPPRARQPASGRPDDGQDPGAGRDPSDQQDPSSGQDPSNRQDPSIRQDPSGRGPAAHGEEPVDRHTASGAGLGRRDWVDWHMSNSGAAADFMSGDAATMALENAGEQGTAAGFAPILPGEDSGLQMHRKLPRGLHVWFAAGLGVLAVGVIAAQHLWAIRQPEAVAARGTPAAISTLEEPTLSQLEQELARERSAARGPRPQTRSALAGASGGALMPQGSAPAGIGTIPPLAVMRGPGFLAAAADGAPSGPDPALGPGADEAALAATVPPELMAPGSAAAAALPADSDRSRALVAGSRILALSHVTPGGLAGEAPDPLEPSGASLRTRLGAIAQARPQLLHDASAVLRQLAAPGLPGGSAPAGEGSAEMSVDSVQTTAVLRPRPAPDELLLLEGTAIPCVLVTELRSDLPGMIVAQVSDDTYDSLTQRVRLIPRGTRLVGHYQNQLAANQQRLLASFHRMIFPDGSSVDLRRMDAADLAGTAGLADEVDTHFWSRFGNSFLTAALARAAERSQSPVGSSISGGVLPGPDATGQILVDTSRSSLQTSAGQAPTITIRRGIPFTVMVNHDLALPATGPRE